ncbi:hypothetical protein B0H14DRAFT_2561782 [Mycena olivaceomarginata]|nr:hypothetical protein B0H14DRAFT_2561782 [Mycena olivaceomarginata]
MFVASVYERLGHQSYQMNHDTETSVCMPLNRPQIQQNDASASFGVTDFDSRPCRIWLRGGLPGKEDAKRIQGFTNQWGIYNKYPSFIDNEDITYKTVGKRSAGGSVRVIRRRGIINRCSTLNGKATAVYNATAGKWVVRSGDRRDKGNRIGIWLRGGLPGKEDAKRIQGFTNQWGIYNKYPSFIDNEDITCMWNMKYIVRKQEFLQWHSPALRISTRILEIDVRIRDCPESKRWLTVLESKNALKVVQFKRYWDVPAKRKMKVSQKGKGLDNAVQRLCLLRELSRGFSGSLVHGWHGKPSSHRWHGRAPIPRASGLANEFPSSMEKTKSEAAALTVVHDYAVAHEAAGTGSPGTAPVTGGMAAPPISHASGLVNEFPITIHGFYMEGEVYINAEPEPSAIHECSSMGGTRGFYCDGEVYVDTVSQYSPAQANRSTPNIELGDSTRVGFCVNVHLAFHVESMDGDGKFIDQPGGARDGWRSHATCPWASRASRFMGDGIVVNDSQSCRLGFCLLHTTGEFVGQTGGTRDGWRGHATGDWRAFRASRFMSDSRVSGWLCPTGAAAIHVNPLCCWRDDVDPATAAGAGYVRLAPKASDQRTTEENVRYGCLLQIMGCHIEAHLPVPVLLTSSSITAGHQHDFKQNCLFRIPIALVVIEPVALKLFILKGGNAHATAAPTSAAVRVRGRRPASFLPKPMWKCTETRH